MKTIDNGCPCDSGTGGDTTGITVTGDIIVDGDIISLGSGNVTTFSPRLYSFSGSLGPVTYTNQIGTSKTQSYVTLYASELEYFIATPTSTSVGVLLSVMPVPAVTTVGELFIGTGFELPSAAKVTAGTLSTYFYNPLTNDPTPTTGASTNTMYLSGFFFNAVSLTYIPTITSSNGTVTYTTQSGYYYQIGNIVFFSADMDITVTGATAATLTMSLPLTATQRSICATTPVLGGSFAEYPSILSILPAGTTGQFRNPYTQSAVTYTGTGTLQFNVSGTFLRGAGSLFDPYLVSITGTIIETGVTKTAYYTTTNNITYFSIVYTSTATTDVDTTLSLSFLPKSASTSTVISQIYSNLGNIIGILGTGADNAITLYNDATMVPQQLTLTTFSINLVVSGSYINV